MGRGRAKAKQVKVARQLKYSGGSTDLDRLRTEMGIGGGGQESDDHAYADLADRYGVRDGTSSTAADGYEDDSEDEDD